MMSSSSETYYRLLPTELIKRMLTTEWCFGLLLDTGHVLCVEHLNGAVEAADGELWFELEAYPKDAVMIECLPDSLREKAIFAPTRRTNMNVQASKVVAIFDLADC
jgi:hypothetical protein